MRHFKVKTCVSNEVAHEMFSAMDHHLPPGVKRMCMLFWSGYTWYTINTDADFCQTLRTAAEVSMAALMSNDDTRGYVEREYPSFLEALNGSLFDVIEFSPEADLVTEFEELHDEFNRCYERLDALNTRIRKVLRKIDC